jgi:hypothetical protein
VEWGDELIDIIEWFAVYEIPRQPSMKLSEMIRWYLRLFLRPLRALIRHVNFERQMRQWERRQRHCKLATSLMEYRSRIPRTGTTIYPASVK